MRRSGSTERRGSPSTNHHGTPLSIGTTMVSGPISGRALGQAAGRAGAFTAMIRTSGVPPNAKSQSADRCDVLAVFAKLDRLERRHVWSSARTLSLAGDGEPGRDPAADRAGAENANVHGPPMGYKAPAGQGAAK